MKLISLNIWGAHIHGPLLDFMKAHADVDILCLQEVYHRADHKISTDDRWVSLTGLDDIHAKMPSHQSFFRPVVNENYGLASLVHPKIQVLEEGYEWIHENPEYPGFGAAHPRILQWIKCQFNQKAFFVINVHGLWNGQGKTDTPARIEQSIRISHFLKALNAPFVLCGDFNLRPDAESLSIIQNSVPGMKNWIDLSGTISTRSRFYLKPEKFADYIFTSPEVCVSRFEVLSDESSQVSDHLPLLLDFEI
jgi:endonuclease/exonuclease/phosphatase family metal-dependent hydrolase